MADDSLFDNEKPQRTYPGTRMPRYQGQRRRPQHADQRAADETWVDEAFEPDQQEIIMETVKQLIKEGNARRIMIVDDYGTVLHEISLTSGIVGAVLFPSIASLVGLAAMAGRRKIIIQRAMK
jgi:hypothetical protein